MRVLSKGLLASTLLAAAASARFLIYADEWHPTRPTNPEDRVGIDHVVLAFAMANATASFQPKVPISTIRSEFPNAKVSIAVGGWGDDIGFFEVSKTDASIQQFAASVATMLTNTGADGVDIDWEYPGGNGADYKQVPNSEKVYQIEAYPKVLKAIRAAIGNKILSIAVPGKKIDMIGFTAETGPKIWPSVDYVNVMTYDLMNRRDNVTQHHTSVAGSIETIKNYLAIGAPPQKINLGFAYYAKYFTTQGDCGAPPLNCPIVLAEDPVTGKDLLTSGAWTFEKFHMQPVDTSKLTPSYDGTCGPEKNTKCATGCCSQYGNCGTSPEHCSSACQHAFGSGCTDADVAGSWQSAAKNGVTDEVAGAQYYFDAQNQLFWTWDTPELITRKFEEVFRRFGLGGVMAWSLGEDSYDWSHVRRMARELGKGGHASPPVAKVMPQKPQLSQQPQQTQEYQDPQTYNAPEAQQDQENQELQDPQPYDSVQQPPSSSNTQTPQVQYLPQDLPPPPITTPTTTIDDDELPFDPRVFGPDGLEQPATEESLADSSADHSYNVVFVDGTTDGPAGEYSVDPGSPDDYTVNFAEEQRDVSAPARARQARRRRRGVQKV